MTASAVTRVGIDVRMIQNFPTGIGNYLENLIKALAKVPPPFDLSTSSRSPRGNSRGDLSTSSRSPRGNSRGDKLKATPSEVEGSEYQFVLVGNVGNKMEGWAKNQPRLEFVAIKSKPNSVHQHFLLPFELLLLNLDLFWTTPWGASILLWQKYALTIYDLLYRRYPKIASLKARLYEAFVSKWVAKRASVVFTISEFVKDDIEGFLGIKKDKIVNISGAAGDAYQPFNGSDVNGFAIDKTLARHRITKPFFVYLGNFRPHKNLATLLRAFANIHRFEESPLADYSIFNIKLVLIGSVDAKGRDRDSENLLNLLKKLKLQKSVILTGRITDDREVAAILNEAVALVHSSFHEGFGLTVLEAMSCGCPVIAANTTSVPEVVGEAGILVDPHDVGKFVRAMKSVLAGERSDLREKGLEQAKKFSWEKTAKEVLEVFDDYWN